MEGGSADKTKPRLFPSARFTLAMLCFFGCLAVYSLRTNMSFAIVCMVAPPPSNETLLGGFSPNTSQPLLNKCGQEIVKSEGPQVIGEFDWDKPTQGQVLSSFFYGYLGSQVLGGQLALRFGGKRIIMAMVLGSAILTLMSPVAARTHVMALAALRAALGFLQGAIFPAMHTMWSVWAPPLERSVLTGVSYAGAQIGNVMVLPLSGFLCQYGFDGGWASIFYLLGLGTLVWCVLWQFVAADKPSTHPRISAEERDYIDASLEETMGKSDDKPRATPWGSIFTSRAVLACWIGHFAGDWGAYTMLVSMPSFLKDVLGFELSSLGVVSAVPYLAYFFAINFGGAAADFVQNKGILGTLNTRRAAMLVALVGQAVFLVASSYCGCGQEVLVIVFITIGMAVSGLQYSGFVVNYLDIAPPFGGTIMGIGNTISCLGGIISPMVTSILTPDGTQEQWQSVMWVTAGILVTGSVLFSLMAKGEVEEWAKNKKSDEAELQPLNANA